MRLQFSMLLAAAMIAALAAARSRGALLFAPHAHTASVAGVGNWHLASVPARGFERALLRDGTRVLPPAGRLTTGNWGPIAVLAVLAVWAVPVDCCRHTVIINKHARIP